ncbi:MAG TPA: hypothetical protein VFT74_19650, partial [Isosphaeraceae bacterium]|nr:hypothetical protein [Isosphaeraceae bacterium]
MWESEAARAAEPKPAKPVRRAPARPALARKPIDLEDSSMLIPVHREDASTSVAEMPPEEPVRAKPSPVVTPPQMSPPVPKAEPESP